MRMFHFFRSRQTIRYTALALAFMLVVKVIIVDGIRAYRMQNAPVVTVTHDNATGLAMAPSKDVILAPSQNEPRDNNVQSAPYSIPYFDFSDDIPQPDAYRPGQAEPLIAVTLSKLIPLSARASMSEQRT